MEKREVLTEVVQQSGEKTECLHVEHRHKHDSTYPLHRHLQLELNYLVHGEGLARIVGDSHEEVVTDELVLVGSNLEHQWAQPIEFVPHAMEEITIHFAAGLFSQELLSYQPLAKVRDLLKNADRGIFFGPTAIEAVRAKLEQIAGAPTGLDRFVMLIQIISILAESEDYRLLCDENYVHTDLPVDSDRIRRVTEYISRMYREDIRLSDLSKIACMTPSSFSRFFRLRAHMSVSDYIIEKRLHYAAKELAETTRTVVEICYDSGFNNITNFNRIFKSRKGLTPTEYRQKYSTHSLKIS